MLTGQERAERGADCQGRLRSVSWDTWMRGVPGKGSDVVPWMLPVWHQQDSCHARVILDQCPRRVVPVSGTSCWSGSSFSEIICGIFAALTAV